MSINKEKYQDIIAELNGKATLVAVSKTKPVEDIQELYNLGQRDFGENYVQELTQKYEQLPKDIRWHYIEHLQRNKVKLIVPFIHLIHGVDSFKLFDEINTQAAKINKAVDCLLQVHIAREETKFGFSGDELEQTIDTINKYKQLNKYSNANIVGLMGMASFSSNMDLVRAELKYLKEFFDKVGSEFRIQNSEFKILSMGMSADYKIALEEGSNMVRIGSLLFGERNYTV